MNAYGYVVTFSTPDGDRQVRTRAWNAMDAATQSILEVQRDYADGAPLKIVSVAPDEARSLDAALLAGMMGAIREAGK